MPVHAQTGTVAAGQSADHGNLTLTNAAAVAVRINDPQRLMGAGPHFPLPLVAVSDRYDRPHRARQTTSQATTHTLEIDVSYGMPLSLRIHSARFLVADANSRFLPDRRCPYTSGRQYKQRADRHHVRIRLTANDYSAGSQVPAEIRWRYIFEYRV